MTSADEVLDKLPDRAIAKLNEDGSNNHEFNSAAFSFANSWIGQGGTEDAYVEVVSGACLGQTYPKSDLERRLRATYLQAEDSYDPSLANGKEEVRRKLRALRDDLELQDLSPGLRASAIGLVDTGIEVGTWAVDMSSRRLSEITGCSYRTSASHMKRFIDIGLVDSVVYNGRGKARTFSIDLSPFETALDGGTDREQLHTYILARTYVCNYSLLQPLWSKHGLGLTAHKIYNSIDVAQGSTVAMISRATGSDRKTIRNHIPRMVQLGLVIETTNNRYPEYRLNLCPDTAWILEEAGVEESQRNQREKFAKDREEFLQPLDMYKKQREDTLANNPLMTAFLDLGENRGRRFRLTPEGLDWLRELGAETNIGDLWEPPLEYREYVDP